jgi:iron complex outermembrane receptor protein
MGTALMGKKLRNVMMGSGLTLLTNLSFAQSASEATPGGALEEITVTGSLLRTQSAPEEGTAPLNVISSEDIQKRGNTTVFEAVATLPELSGYVDNDSRAGASDTKQVNLRGLGAQYTVVLLNGRRLGANNLNLIPFAAVERIEVLKDGASAVYGSDALAGVVNIILKRNYDGAQISADYGNTTHYGDGSRTNTSAVMGFTGERGELLISGEYQDQNAISSLEHPLGRSDDFRSFDSIDRRVQANNPGVVRFANGTRVMLNPAFTAGQTGASAADYVPVYDNKLSKQKPNDLQNPRNAGTFFASGEYSLLDERLKFFAEFLSKSVKVRYKDHRGTTLDLDVPATNYWNPFGQAVHVTYQLDYGTAPGREERPLETLMGDMNTRMFTVGFRGEIGPFEYDVAHSDWNNDEVQSHNGLSRSGIIAQLARTDPGALNLFGNAAVTEAQLAPARGLFKRDYKDFVTSTTAVVRVSPFSLPAGEVGLAFGAEHRKQGFANILDESLSRSADSISLPFLNDFSLALERKIDAQFAEVSLPLAGADSNIAGVRALDVTLAARREDFNDFGDATVSRATFRWQPLESDALAFRGSYSESFYAPELRDLLPLGDTNNTLLTDPQILVDGAPLRYLMRTINGGNPDLEPTTGKYYNLGVILKPSFIPDLRLIVDAWKLDQVKAFVYPSSQSVVNGTSPGSVTRSTTVLPGEAVGRVAEVIAIPQNAATRTVQGIDFDISYAKDLGNWGRLSVDSNSTFMLKWKYDQANGLGERNALGQVSQYYSGDINPRFRSNLTLGWQLGSVNLSVANIFESGVVNPNDSWHRVDDYIRTNVTTTYDLSSFESLGKTQVWLSVLDLFDQGTPFVFGRTAGLSSDYHYDYVGQFVSVGVRHKF